MEYVAKETREAATKALKRVCEASAQNLEARGGPPPPVMPAVWHAAAIATNAAGTAFWDLQQALLPSCALLPSFAGGGVQLDSLKACRHLEGTLAPADAVEMVDAGVTTAALALGGRYAVAPERIAGWIEDWQRFDAIGGRGGRVGGGTRGGRRRRRPPARCPARRRTVSVESL